MASRTHGDTTWAWVAASSAWVSGSLSLSILSLYPLSRLSLSLSFSFFLFFSLFFLLSSFGVGLLTTESWVFFFLIDLPGSWAPGLAGWWAGGGFMIFGRGPELKTKGGPSPFFFGFSENFTSQKKFFFLGPGRARAPFGLNVGPSVRSAWI